MPELNNDKQERFCWEYCKDLNQTRAAIRAGYSPVSAGQQSSALMKKPNIRARIEELQAHRAARLQLDMDDVLAGLLEVKGRCMQATPVMTFDQVEKKMKQAKDADGNDIWMFDSRGANQSLELIGKHLGMFKDNMNIRVEQVPKIIDDIETESADDRDM